MCSAADDPTTHEPWPYGFVFDHLEKFMAEIAYEAALGHRNAAWAAWMAQRDRLQELGSDPDPEVRREVIRAVNAAQDVYDERKAAAMRAKFNYQWHG